MGYGRERKVGRGIGRRREKEKIERERKREGERGSCLFRRGMGREPFVAFEGHFLDIKFMIGSFFSLPFSNNPLPICSMLCCLASFS